MRYEGFFGKGGVVVLGKVEDRFQGWGFHLFF